MELLQIDVLDAQAEALLLTVDGAKAGLEGNIARQLARRWPDDWHDMARAIRYPIPLGRTVALEWEGDAPWRLYLFASTLHHTDILDDAQKVSVVSAAFFEALQLCAKHRVATLATPVLQGGWRLPKEVALETMQTQAMRGAAQRLGVSVKICAV